jgi:hypothetical protein
MNKFLKTHKLTKVTEDTIENLNLGQVLVGFRQQRSGGLRFKASRGK